MTDPAVLIRPTAVSAPEVVRYVETRAPRAIDSWRDLGEAEYARAFAAARTAGWDVITDLHDGLVKTLNADGDATDFADRVVPVLRQKGWLGETESELGERVRLIFDTNLRVARAAGRWQRIQRSKAVMPYLRAVTARDPRVRQPPKSRNADHRVWEGITLPVDHPFWLRAFPPLYFRCRCDVIQLTRSQFERRGYRLTTEAELATRERALGPTWGAARFTGSAEQLIAQVVQAAAERALDGLAALRPEPIRAASQAAFARTGAVEEAARVIAAVDPSADRRAFLEREAARNRARRARRRAEAADRGPVEVIPARPAPADVPLPRPVTTVTQSQVEAEGWTVRGAAPVDFLNDQLGGRSPEAILNRMVEGTGLKIRSKATSWNSNALAIKVGFGTESRSAGTLIRRFSRAEDGRLIVDHTLLTLSKKGGGTGKALLRNQVALYEEMGVDTVTIHAALDVGGYAWARFGFVPTMRSWQTVSKTIGWRVDRMNLPPDVEAQVRALLANPDPLTMWKVSDLRFPVDGEPLGKSLLLGTDWYGELNLRSEATMARFRAYVDR